MAAQRLCTILAAACLALIAVWPAAGNNDGDGISAREAELLTDFLILAVKPEGDERDYKLVEIGDTKIDAGLLGVVVNALPLDFLGLGPSRDYDEAAELAQCRAACAANAQCRNFTYVRPTRAQPVGVCRLQKPSDFGVMTPVDDAHDRREPPIKEPARETAEPGETIGGATVVIDATQPKGRERFADEDARLSPVTVKFTQDVATTKVFIRAAEQTGERLRATVDAFDARGKRIERTGATIAGYGQAIAITGEADRIATLKITGPSPGALQLDGVEYTRTLIAPTPVAVADAKPETTKPEAPRETIPPPPKLPPFVAEYFPLPPRATPTAPPTSITPENPAPIEPPPLVAEPPAPPASVVEAPPAEPARKRGLPLWVALGAIAVMFAGAGLYWRNHRVRTLGRLSTRLVSNGLDRQTITLENVEGADHSLRVVVRTPANANIELIPKGAVA